MVTVSAICDHGVIIPWTTQGKGLFQYYEKLLEGLARDLGFSLNTPWKNLKPDVQEAILRGNNFEVKVKWKNRYGREMSYTSGFEGVMPYIERQFLQPTPTHSAPAGASTCARCRARSVTASG